MNKIYVLKTTTKHVLIFYIYLIFVLLSHIFSFC